MPQEKSIRALRSLIEATSRVTGVAFFDALTLNLTRALGVKHAILGELDGPRRSRSRTRSVVWDGAPSKNFVYDLSATPCEAVLGRGEVVYYPDDVAAKFPDDATLTRRGIRAYMGTPLKSSSGEYLGLLVIMNDAPIDLDFDPESILLLFAERAAAELQQMQSVARLEESEDILRFALSAAKMARWSLKDGALSWSGVELLFEAHPSTLPELLSLLEPHERPRLLRATRRCRVDREPLDMTCRALTAPDEESRWLRFKGELNQRGGGAQIFGVVLDETHRVRREARLQERNRMKAQSRLAGGIAHDLNNLLTVITMNVNLDILENGSCDDCNPLNKLILEASERMSRLVNQLEMLSHEREVTLRNFNPNHAIEELMHLLSEVLGGGIEVKLSLDEAESMVIMDYSQFEQVFLNLAKNAAEAMPAGGVFEIASERRSQEHEICFTVRDTGGGIAPELIPRIIEPFYSTKAAQGRGLGMSICHSVIDRAGGLLEIESEVGQGTTFTITLPILR